MGIAGVLDVQNRCGVTIDLGDARAYDLQVRCAPADPGIDDDSDAACDRDVQSAFRPHGLFVALDQQGKAALPGRRLCGRLHLEPETDTPACRHHNLVALNGHPGTATARSQFIAERNAAVRRQCPIRRSQRVLRRLGRDVRDFDDLARALSGIDGYLEARRRDDGSELLRKGDGRSECRHGQNRDCAAEANAGHAVQSVSISKWNARPRISGNWPPLAWIVSMSVSSRCGIVMGPS